MKSEIVTLTLCQVSSKVQKPLKTEQFSVKILENFVNHYRSQLSTNAERWQIDQGAFGDAFTEAIEADKGVETSEKRNNFREISRSSRREIRL